MEGSMDDKPLLVTVRWRENFFNERQTRAARLVSLFRKVEKVSSGGSPKLLIGPQCQYFIARPANQVSPYIWLYHG
jgi:hypothetical protein